jgi:peptidoglycan hydrolase-like protein with peptidoglycan-binding domain
MAHPTIRLNDQGPAVELAQDLLNRAGAILVDDGKYGAASGHAVREFRRARGLPDSTDVDAAVWTLLTALPLPNPDIPTRAVAFIAREEVSGRDYYDRFCTRPTWPGGASGLTIGVGYDLGYQSDFARDWADLLSPVELARLKPWIGIKGSEASTGPGRLTGMSVPWHAAWEGYIRRTLPQEVRKTRATFTAPVGRRLPKLCLGMLVSLVYNRGTAMQDDSVNDRRREMRQIRDAVTSGCYDEVPDLLRSMRRLWPAGNGLRARRDREAEMFEQGLSQP